MSELREIMITPSGPIGVTSRHEPTPDFGCLPLSVAVDFSDESQVAELEGLREVFLCGAEEFNAWVKEVYEKFTIV